MTKPKMRRDLSKSVLSQKGPKGLTGFFQGDRGE